MDLDRRERARPRQKDLDTTLLGWARGLCHEWSEPELAERISLSFSVRLKRSLGRCRPDRGEIRLASWLEQAPETILREVICHEVAHAVTYVRHGGACRPHGTEWRALMVAAGQPARARLPADALPLHLRHYTRPNLPYRHRCARCQATRNGRRAMPHWRCGRCLEAGYDGRLTIARRAPDAPGDALGE